MLFHISLSPISGTTTEEITESNVELPCCTSAILPLMMKQSRVKFTKSSFNPFISLDNCSKVHYRNQNHQQNQFVDTKEAGSRVKDIHLLGNISFLRYLGQNVVWRGVLRIRIRSLVLERPLKGKSLF
jgi:hypothetical protein